MATCRIIRSIGAMHTHRLHMHASAGVPRNLRLPPMPTIRDLLKLYKLSAQKKLSQNFLLDSRIIDKIAKAAIFKPQRQEGLHAVEVGPGPGGITRSLFKYGAERVTIIEKDRRFLPTLEMLEDACGKRLTIHWGDVLSFNMSDMFTEDMRVSWEEGEIHPDRIEILKEEEEFQPQMHKKVKGRMPRLLIVGNLPFNISTPLIIRWVRDISQRKNIWSYGRVPLTLTFQKEVAERINANVGEAQRCRLSIMCQNWCYVEHKFNIPGSAFIPKPKVDVGVVRLVPRPEPLIPLPFSLVEKVVRTIFSSRQKFIKHTAAKLFPPGKGGENNLLPSREELTEEFFLLSGVNYNIRAFRVTIKEFGQMCDAYLKMCERYPVLERYEYRQAKDVERSNFEDDIDEEELEKKWEGFDDGVLMFDKQKQSTS